MFSQLLNSIKMDLGSCFAVFFVIALVLLLLFCLLLKWYAYLQKKKRKLLAQGVQTVQESESSVENQTIEGQYEQYCQRKEEREKYLDQKLLQDELVSDYPLKRQITKISNDLYGLSSLRQRLNHSLSSHDPFANHSGNISLKDFSIKRINTVQTKTDSTSGRNLQEYLKRLICYEVTGISLIEISEHTLTKTGDHIALKMKVQQTFIQSSGSEFESILQSLGLQRQVYCCGKTVYQLDTSQLKNNLTYTLKSLQLRQQKLSINKQEYMRLLEKIKEE